MSIAHRDTIKPPLPASPQADLAAPGQERLGLLHHGCRGKALNKPPVLCPATSADQSDSQRPSLRRVERPLKLLGCPEVLKVLRIRAVSGLFLEEIIGSARPAAADASSCRAAWIGPYTERGQRKPGSSRKRLT
ncbi:hypothetical protein BJA5080_07865 [Bradyrhizobium diazoefficiens SEMIA 5080]|uniref:Uncharacterized protein n=1 Tax=Bradyrhizobium diazoefficiens SEMIA 5080 TaxID=754504 RepID=A0A837CPL0_9BRAD|nr:hypothetical protein BJA5080_07865 [Bradyrhizobium diazoefficiens SEMIA 5080]